ncbi:hypothetical protein JCM18899A_41160 [Nocardioides sp. AN3]
MHVLVAVMKSRAALVVGTIVALSVPLITLPRLPHVDAWPLLLGLLPWVVGKYLLCPLRWRALTRPARPRSWHLRAYAESELLGLLTPGHVGADLWRIARLTRAGAARGDAVLSVGADRLVGAVALALFVGFAGAALPTRMLVVAGILGVVLVGGVLVLRRLRPHLFPTRPWPPPKDLLHGLVLSLGYQLSIAGLLLGAVAATGHHVAPLALLGAFGASQLAGAVPGPNGASPRDGALVAALVALGMPWTAALAAVSLKAALAWLPAILLGGASLLMTRRAMRRADEASPA